MGRRRQVAEEVEERSPFAGALVLVVLGGVVLAVVFAISETAGILVTVAASAAATWWAVSRPVPDSSATPPPSSAGPSGDVYAVEGDRAREVRRTPGEGYLIFPEIVHTTDPDTVGEVDER
ncbi:hypothetical protein [Streptomyces sp. NPDC005549]|uniref:hypothetical protein n=1 Tax=Streptomyces sp. NPDC005549 TaxID=3154888 RepID=UPI0033B59D61